MPCSWILVKQRAIRRYKITRKIGFVQGNGERDGFFEEELYLWSSEAYQSQKDWGIQIEAGRQHCRAEVQDKVSCKGLQSEEMSWFLWYIFTSHRDVINSNGVEDSSQFRFGDRAVSVKNAFLHRELQDVIYMKQPEEFIKKGKEKLVCKLKKKPVWI